jgi:hypothetical protein
LHAGGQRFDPAMLHHISIIRLFFENWINDIESKIFTVKLLILVKLLRAHGGCLGTRSR